VTNNKFVLLCAGAAFFGFAWVKEIKNPTPPATPAVEAAAVPEPLRKPSQATLCTVVEIIVERDYLKSGEGTFRGCHIVDVSDDKRLAVVAGFVTATNGYGAKIKTPYVAALQRTSDALSENDIGAWRLTGVKFTES
jgi:hypothetical protein